MEKYNGWASYATWRISTGLDEERHSQCIELAELARQQAEPVAWLADELKYLVTCNRPLTGDMYGDILEYAIDGANFREIAESILEELGN